MTRLMIVTTALLLAGALTLTVAWAQDETATNEASPAAPSHEGHDHAADAHAAPQATDAEMDYALGFIIGMDLRRQGLPTPRETGEFTAGILAGLGHGEPKMNQQQIEAAMVGFQARMMGEVAKVRAEGEAFLAENAGKEGVVTTDTGLQIKTLEAGDGPQAKEGDVVTVHYEGRLIDGTVFDQSQPDQPLVWDPRQFSVIPGWTEGLTHMNVGGKYELYVPADLGYGDRPNGQIPAGSTLIFKMELVDAKTPDPNDAPALPQFMPME